LPRARREKAAGVAVYQLVVAGPAPCSVFLRRRARRSFPTSISRRLLEEERRGGAERMKRGSATEREWQRQREGEAGRER
jgi:hypothetical protein